MNERTETTDRDLEARGVRPLSEREDPLCSLSLSLSPLVEGGCGKNRRSNLLTDAKAIWCILAAVVKESKLHSGEETMREPVRIMRSRFDQLASATRVALNNRSFFMRSGSGAVLVETGAMAPSSLCAHRFALNSYLTTQHALRRALPAAGSGAREMSGTRLAENGDSVVPFNLADIGEGITGAFPCSNPTHSNGHDQAIGSCLFASSPRK